VRGGRATWRVRLCGLDACSTPTRRSSLRLRRAEGLARFGPLDYIIQVAVRITPEADADFGRLPVVIRIRVEAVFGRLAAWPRVSGARPLSGALAGHFRIRTGDWRIMFRPQGADVVVVRIQHRSEVYER
jgi:mRNA-degrading endonuclease RelE of RelBE toxin-antitoxin system